MIERFVPTLSEMLTQVKLRTKVELTQRADIYIVALPDNISKRMLGDMYSSLSMINISPEIGTAVGQSVHGKHLTPKVAPSLRDRAHSTSKIDAA
jgi:hypothetical protein